MAVLSRVVPIVDSVATLAYSAKGHATLKTDALLYVDNATFVFYCGGPGVTNTGASRGVPFNQASPLSVSGRLGDDFYVIAAAGQSADLVVLATGV